MKILSVLILMLASLQGYSQTLEERVDELETASILNSVRFNGEFVTRMDHIFVPYRTEKKNTATTSYDTGVAVPVASTPLNREYTNDSYNIHRELFALDMTVNVNPELSFYGRMTASKMMNEFIIVSPSSNSDQSARGFSGTTIHMERAYFNWKMLENLTLSAGRLPTLEGGPLHLTLGQPSRGTYPRLAYSAVLDGYAITYNIGGVALRGLYHPLGTVQRSGGSFNETPVSFTPYNRLDGFEVSTAGEIYALMADYNTSSFGFTRNFNAVAQYFIINDISSLDNTVEIADVTTGAITNYTKYNESIDFDYTQAVVYLEFQGLMNSGLSLGLSHSMTKSKNNRDFGSLPVGFMTSEAKAVNGAASLLTVAYQLPVEFLKNPVVGAEQIQSDRYYQFFNGNQWDPFGFHGIRGSGTHIFYNQKLTDGLKLRLGHMSVSPKYASGFASGDPAELTGDYKQTLTTTYAEFRLGF